MYLTLKTLSTTTTPKVRTRLQNIGTNLDRLLLLLLLLVNEALKNPEKVKLLPNQKPPLPLPSSRPKRLSVVSSNTVSNLFLISSIPPKILNHPD